MGMPMFPQFICRSSSFRLKELEASIRAQVAAEEKAHQIVETLVLEDEISEDFLIHSVSLVVLVA